MGSLHSTSLRLMGASVRGPLHFLTGLPCQDACAFETIDSERAAIAVADGLGSVPHADVGALAAVNAAVACIRELCNGVRAMDGRNAVDAAMTAARQAVTHRSIELQCELRELACTLLVVFIQAESVHVAHIGDGAVIVQTDDALVLLSGPGDSEYSNEVVPLTAGSWKLSVHNTEHKSGARSVAVITDGCQRAGLRMSGTGREPYAGFFRPVFEYASQLPSGVDGNQEISDLLNSQKLQENSEDDKSLVIAVLARSEAHAAVSI